MGLSIIRFKDRAFEELGVFGRYISRSYAGGRIRLDKGLNFKVYAKVCSNREISICRLHFI